MVYVAWIRENDMYRYWNSNIAEWVIAHKMTTWTSFGDAFRESPKKATILALSPKELHHLKIAYTQNEMR